MTPLPWSLLDIYTLALPRGHGFGQRPPEEAWTSEDGIACAIITRHAQTGDIGLIVMRRRVDHVWTVILDKTGIDDLDHARTIARTEIKEGQPPEPIPPSVPRRPSLVKREGRDPSKMFMLLAQPSHLNGAWVLNQLYLSMPRPDRNWVSDFQTGNFHTRLWEAQLLASFREQGLLVTQPEESPDFRIENRLGGAAWVEAVTANPQMPYEHFNARPVFQPDATEELFFGEAAVRFAKTIGSKLQRRYDQLPHVQGQPFALAVADFHAPSSMVWSRQALLGYLMGLGAARADGVGRSPMVVHQKRHLLGASSFPAGLFTDDRHSELSAIIFTNACTLGKFNRIALSRGMTDRGLRFIRYGTFFDRNPDALDGIPFCLDVQGKEYLSLWPQGYEPWCAELEVIHNPFAQHPLPEALIPEATHWFRMHDEWICRSHYATSILSSRTLIQNASDPVPTYDSLPEHLYRLARRAIEEARTRTRDRDPSG
ncbi:hypothetical protein BBF93_04560 [Hyphomonas sp. CACIAM 19H1]|uniref:hypothetical protein n=1 Tax=Hyphomonas sp. CACIAM 19H1 TaxID=1873716 RepID=UPI000DEE0A4D|nr:hypothetical protein [Hyphomonas sp. CACIAM 19H1]AXE63570.1 hypothetical protein BBF93_04560 [Hyphomonas sp. CACIAM 19H1]